MEFLQLHHKLSLEILKRCTWQPHGLGVVENYLVAVGH
jgi:hypothetical protein